MHEEWPKFDHKPAIMRAFKSADLDSDGYIRGAEEFELMIRGLTFFNNLWHHFESFDKDDDHRLDEDEFVAGVATLAHPSDHRAWGSLCASLGARPIGVDEAKTEFALLAGGMGTCCSISSVRGVFQSTRSRCRRATGGIAPFLNRWERTQTRMPIMLPHAEWLRPSARWPRRRVRQRSRGQCRP